MMSPENSRVETSEAEMSAKSNHVEDRRIGHDNDEEEMDDDVAKFDGKIVYNPDGSAYIIEDCDLNEDDENLPLPKQEGCIVELPTTMLSTVEPMPKCCRVRMFLKLQSFTAIEFFRPENRTRPKVKSPMSKVLTWPTLCLQLFPSNPSSCASSASCHLDAQSHLATIASSHTQWR